MRSIITPTIAALINAIGTAATIYQSKYSAKLSRKKSCTTKVAKAPIINSSPWAILIIPITPYVIARPSAANKRILPRLNPVKTRVTVSPINIFCSRDANDSAAAARTELSASLAGSVISVSFNLISGLSLSPRSFTAFSLTAGSELWTPIMAFTNVIISLISESLSFAKTRSMMGRKISSAPPVSSICLAASSLTSRSGLNNFNIDMLVFNTTRTRLFG